ncbi:hypothetical protein PF007_g18999 [Phytophthora fragariae]|uniref:Uncharacterized protein n=1 Tax=Phytophthora fragariae TaxID=53985 RepID=A0A6A4CQ37_9STRA|nr:hypothetical protein PF007_g18999 [Phytophthora fragariae]KAE9293161.1 hypothetical protein PF001_g18386 [Phytophthora fragariae]
MDTGLHSHAAVYLVLGFVLLPESFFYVVSLWTTTFLLCRVLLMTSFPLSEIPSFVSFQLSPNMMIHPRLTS